MRKAMILAATMALLVAMMSGAALAKGKSADKVKPAKKKVPTVAYVFEGTVASVDELNGTVTVDVADANKFADSYLRGQGTNQVTVAVDGTTRIKKDDARATLADLAIGDEIKVKDRAPRGATTFVANMVVAETPVAEDEPIVESDPLL